MTENKIITFGKYSGYNYNDLMEKDINYCKFIHGCPPNDKTKDFKEYLNEHLEGKIKERNLKYLNKSLKMQSV